MQSGSFAQAKFLGLLSYLLAFFKALFRTRTGDPLLTMEVLYQLS